VFLFIASVLFAVSLSTLFFYHCYLVACNKSTIGRYLFKSRRNIICLHTSTTGSVSVTVRGRVLTDLEHAVEILLLDLSNMIVS
jgi:hypothetical protein